MYKLKLRISNLGNFFPALLVASTPFAGWGLFNIGSSFSFTASYAVCIFAIIFGAIKGHFGSNQSLQYRKFIAIPLLTITSFSFVPMLFWNYSNGMQFTNSYLHLLFWIISIDVLLRSASDLERSIQIFLKIYLWFAILVVGLGFYDLYLRLFSGVGMEVIFNVRVREVPAEASFLSLPRESSIFFEPGWYAHYVLSCLILVVTWMIPNANKNRNLFYKLFLIVIAVIFGIAILSTLSASAIAVSIATLLFIIFSKPKPIRKITFLIAILFVFSLLPLPGEIPNPISVLFDRFYGLYTGEWVSGESADSRSAEIQGAINLFFRSNMLGIGYGQSAYYLTEIEPVGTAGISSYYALLMAETGVLGFTVFVLAIFGLNIFLFKVQRSIKPGNPLENAFFSIRYLLFSESLFLNFFSNFSSSFYASSIWLVFATLYVVAHQLKKN